MFLPTCIQQLNDGWTEEAIMAPPHTLVLPVLEVAPPNKVRTVLKYYQQSTSTATYVIETSTFLLPYQTHDFS